MDRTTDPVASDYQESPRQWQMVFVRRSKIVSIDESISAMNFTWGHVPDTRTQSRLTRKTGQDAITSKPLNSAARIGATSPTRSRSQRARLRVSET